MKMAYMTGGTGFLGSHFIRNHLSTGQYDVRCFVRGDNDEQCTQRLKHAVVAVNTSYLGRVPLNLDGVSAIQSDITRPLLGLREEWLETERNRATGATFFHFASSLNFEEQKKDVIYDHNINGLRHAMKVASELRCAAFFYISTAYTVGVHEGHVVEELHHPLAFNNYYEETKCAAEHLITKLCEAKGVRLVIFRPSVVIGPSKSRKPGGSKTGLYGFLRDLYYLKRHLKDMQVPVALYGNPDAGINLIPVDYVCHDIFRIFEDPDVEGGLYHVTADNNMNVGALVELILQHLELHNVTFERSERFDSERASAIENFLVKKMTFYSGVTRTTKTFDKKAGSKWILGRDEVERYIIEGVRVFAALQEQTADHKKVVVTQDRVPLNVYDAGETTAEAVVFINAIGMPAELSSHLRKSLQAKYHFITWESRGIPSFVEDIDAVDVSVEAHISDLLCIMDYFKIEKAHIIGWCSGAYIAYQALRTNRISSLTLINGTYGFSENTDAETPFLRNLRVSLPTIAESRNQAARYHAAFFMRNAGIGTTAEDVRQSTEVLDASDPDLVHLTSKPFETPECLYNYSRVITSLRKTGHIIKDGPLGLPCHVIAGMSDQTVSPIESKMLFEKHADANFVAIDDMDHFGVYNSPALTRNIIQFLASASSAPSQRVGLQHRLTGATRSTTGPCR